MARELNISKFSADTKFFGGYVYTKNQKLSSLIANQYQTETTLKLVNIKGKRVIDIGCGDGTYTQEWFRLGKPKLIFAFDPSIEAIKSATKNNRYKTQVTYKVGDIYNLPTKQQFDVAIVRGVLHHLYKPEKAMKQISKIAHKVILIEPNGYNPVLKIIEKTSPYHLEHEEKSYPPHQIDIWIVKNKGKIENKIFAGLVPFFCPDMIAKFLKSIEPVIEKLPLIREISCANYYVVYSNLHLPST